MALNSLYCADVPLSNYSLTHSLTADLARESKSEASAEQQHNTPR